MKRSGSRIYAVISAAIIAILVTCGYCPSRATTGDTTPIGPNFGFGIFSGAGGEATATRPRDRAVFEGASSVRIQTVPGSKKVRIIGGAGGGLPRGSCWGNELGWSQASAVQNTWYLISNAGMTDGVLSNITHDGSGKLTVPTAGHYLVNYSTTLTTSVGQHIQTGVAVNGTAVNDCIAHVDVTGPSVEITNASTCILNLTANATVEGAIRTTDTGTPTLGVDHLNLTVTHIGSP